VSPDVPEEAAPEELPELEPVVVVVVDVEVTPVLVVTAVLLLLPEVPSATVPSATKDQNSFEHLELKFVSKLCKLRLRSSTV